MRILYVGNTRASWCSEVHIGRALTELGCEVVHVQEDELRAQDKMRRLRKTVGEYDAMFYMRTWGPPGMASLISACKRAGVTTVTLSLDIYWGVKREWMVKRDPMFRSDHVFTADGNDRDWEKHRINHHWLRAGVVRDECVDVMPGRYRSTWSDIDIAFVGSGGLNYHAEWPRQQLIDALRKRYGMAFAHVGLGGDFQDPATGAEVLRGQALNDLFATVDVIVGDSLGATSDTRYWSDRFYETWGRGGYLIHPQIEALSEEVGSYPSYPCSPSGHFLDLLFEEIDGALDTRDTLIEDTKERLSATVREQCTYTDRMRTVLEVIT